MIHMTVFFFILSFFIVFSNWRMDWKFHVDNMCSDNVVCIEHVGHSTLNVVLIDIRIGKQVYSYLGNQFIWLDVTGYSQDYLYTLGEDIYEYPVKFLKKTRISYPHNAVSVFDMMKHGYYDPHRNKLSQVYNDFDCVRWEIDSE